LIFLAVTTARFSRKSFKENHLLPTKSKGMETLLPRMGITPFLEAAFYGLDIEQVMFAWRSQPPG
jgi:hypothetical protein